MRFLLLIFFKHLGRILALICFPSFRSDLLIVTCALIILLLLQISQSHHFSRRVGKRRVLGADVFYHKILRLFVSA